MKKIISVLILSIFIVLNIITPTSVFADVVIGDNDDLVVNQNAKILGRKLAMLESLNDLLLDGATEFAITNTTDIDTYLDYLWDEVDNAIDSLSNPDNWQNLTTEVRNKYLSDVINYQNYINGRGGDLSFQFNNPSDSFLSTWFSGNTYGKGTYVKHDVTLPMARALSIINNESPNVDVPSEYQVFINQLINSQVNDMDLNSGALYRGQNYHMNFTFNRPVSWVCQNPNSATDWSGKMVKPVVKSSINIYTNQDGTCSWASSLVNAGYIQRVANSNGYVADNREYGLLNTSYKPDLWFTFSNSTFNNPNTYQFNSLTLCFNYLVQHFKYFDVYVDGELWGATGVVSNPTLDIDGLMKVFGNNNPIEYELQPGTQIDYDQLYQVIYNAIRDNLPVSQGDITYYDSHDTTYSPTIINYNSGDSDGESDFIDSILDYAIIPKFDTAMLAPIEVPFENGVRILNVSVGYGTIPNDILVVLGALAVLGLFVIIINRMLE